MTAIIVSLLFIAAIFTLIVIFKWLQNRERSKRVNRLIKLFQKTGEKGGLTFSSQEVLRNKVIGLDGLNRKFVVVNEDGESQIINLNDVRRCLLQKRWIAETGDSGSNSRVSYIQLHFDLRDETYEQVIFYDHCIHCGAEQAELETKANDWKIILSKLISPKKERA